MFVCTHLLLCFMYADMYFKAREEGTWCTLPAEQLPCDQQQQQQHPDQEDKEQGDVSSRQMQLRSTSRAASAPGGDLLSMSVNGNQLQSADTAASAIAGTYEGYTRYKEGALVLTPQVLGFGACGGVRVGM